MVDGRNKKKSSGSGKLKERRKREREEGRKAEKKVEAWRIDAGLQLLFLVTLSLHLSY